MHPPPKVIRQARRSIPVEVERLEPRCLLAGLATLTEQFVAGGPNQEQVIPEGIPAVATTSAAGAATSPTAGQASRTDAYVLAAGVGEPEVHVEIRWAGGADVGDGSTLVVLDASGTTLYTFPLDDAAGLQATMDIPSAPGSDAGSLPLGLSLIVRRGDAGSGDPGSYQLALAWQTTSTPLTVPWVPDGLTAPAAFAPADSTAVLASPAMPTLWAARALPAVLIPGVATGTVAEIPPPSTVTGGTSGGTGTTATTPVAVPDPSTAGTGGPVATPAPTAGGATAGGHAGTVPIASTPAAATPTPAAAADRGAATYVGPLPLGPSVPDGGIFASSFSSGAPPGGAGSSHGAAAGESRVPGLAVGSTAADLIAGVGRLVSFGAPRDFRVAPPVQQGLPVRSGAWPVGDDAAPGALAAGAAFLPALAAPAATRPASPASPPSRGRSTDSRRGWISPVVAALAVLTTSAVLVLKLHAPSRRPDWRS